MIASRSILRRLRLRQVGAWLSLAVLAVGVLPASVVYRCLKMGTVMSAPCCDRDSGAHATDSTVIDAACCERLAPAVVTVAAVREPAAAHATPTLVVFTLPRAFVLHGSHLRRASAAWLRAGPHDPVERIATVVLRV